MARGNPAHWKYKSCVSCPSSYQHTNIAAWVEVNTTTFPAYLSEQMMAASQSGSYEVSRLPLAQSAWNIDKISCLFTIFTIRLSRVRPARPAAGAKCGRQN